MSARIALFPLRTVLFPEGLLPLRIFETRYVDMVRRCMRGNEVFGVVLIRDGAEVGEVGEVAAVGTAARIVDFGVLPDGLLSVVARGERRFRLLSRTQQKDGLHLGEVDWLDDPPEALEAGEHAALRGLLAHALDDLGAAYPAGPPRMDDALWVCGHLGQLLQLPALARQQILETEGARARLRQLEAVHAAGREPRPQG